MMLTLRNNSEENGNVKIETMDTGDIVGSDILS